MVLFFLPLSSDDKPNTDEWMDLERYCSMDIPPEIQNSPPYEPLSSELETTSPQHEVSPL